MSKSEIEGYLDERNIFIDDSDIEKLKNCKTLKDQIEMAQSISLISKVIKSQTLTNDLERILEIAEISDRYIFQAVEMPIHMYATKQSLTKFGSDLGWGPRISKKWSMYEFSGNHHSIVKRGNVERLGSLITGTLTKLEQINPKPPENIKFTVVPLQLGANKGPIICIPGAGGSAASFMPLIETIRKDISVYGLQPRGHSPGEVPHTSVESAAEDYLKTLQSVMPEEPEYCYIGHSFGGWIAFEMACKLQSQGKGINSVVLLDTAPPDYIADSREWTPRSECIAKLVHLLEQHVGSEFNITVDDLLVQSYYEQNQILTDRMVYHGLVSGADATQTVESLIRVFSTNLNTNYCPKEYYRGNVELILPELDEEDSPANRDEMIRIWEMFAQNIRVKIVPGNHMSMLKTGNCNSIVEHLNKTRLSSIK